MSTDAPAALQTAATDDGIDLDRRDVDALTRSMTVLDDYDRADGADDLYMVVSDSGKEYLVDIRAGRCECPDYQYRETTCIHQRRVAFATGRRAIPAWADTDTDAVDPNLGDHVAGKPRQAVTDGGIVEAGDDGEILDEGDDDGRPDDCDCGDWNPSDHIDLPCWPCYREGFDVPNPSAGEE